MKTIKQLEKGCGKKISIIWNFGSKVTVSCGWKEDGFMPNYCEECENKLTKLRSAPKQD